VSSPTENGFSYWWVSSRTETLKCIDLGMSIFHRRQGQMELNYAYFYTITINNFQCVLYDDYLKQIIIQSWKYLIKKDLIEIYGYVIMPNHIHLLWNVKSMNGKESPAGSFTKYTAHEFKKYLQEKSPQVLEQFTSGKRDRKYQFWKRDALAIPISTESIFLQKLEYIHLNPLRDNWKLCAHAEDYRWSSAGFYLKGFDEFGILKHFKDAYA
jgi:putative transposase